MEDRLTLQQAADQLGVIRRRVQALVAEGVLPAEKLGSQWVVPASAVHAFNWNRTARPGRPLSQRRSWERIAALGDEDGMTFPLLDAYRRRVRPRATHYPVFVHPGAVDSLRNDQAVVLSGRDAASAAGAPVDPGTVDVYVRRSERDALVRRHRARPTGVDANVYLHVVDDDVWPFADGQRFVSPWVAWLDLEDREDRAATTLLDRILGGRLLA